MGKAYKPSSIQMEIFYEGSNAEERVLQAVRWAVKQRGEVNSVKAHSNGSHSWMLAATAVASHADGVVRTVIAEAEKVLAGRADTLVVSSNRNPESGAREVKLFTGPRAESLIL